MWVFSVVRSSRKLPVCDKTIALTVRPPRQRFNAERQQNVMNCRLEFSSSLSMHDHNSCYSVLATTSEIWSALFNGSQRLMYYLFTLTKINLCWIFCVRFNWSSVHAFILNFSKISILKTASYLSIFENCKKWFLLISSCRSYIQVSPGIPQQVADLFRRCQVAIQFLGTKVIFPQLLVLQPFLKCILCN